MTYLIQDTLNIYAQKILKAHQKLVNVMSVGSLRGMKSTH